MNIVKLPGNVDENRLLSAQVPASIRPGPVTVLVAFRKCHEERSGAGWTAGNIAQAPQWMDELADPARHPQAGAILRLATPRTFIRSRMENPSVSPDEIYELRAPGQGSNSYAIHFGKPPCLGY